MNSVGFEFGQGNQEIINYFCRILFHLLKLQLYSCVMQVKWKANDSHINILPVSTTVNFEKLLALEQKKIV